MTAETVIIDTGCANLSSVRFAFERLGADVLVTDDADAINAATRLVLPGVGSAPAAMSSLKQKNLITLVQGLTQPVLGVCLGMQLMTEKSTEQGAVAEDTPCLGLIPSEVRALDTQGLPTPHMGWNQLKPVLKNGQPHPLFAGIDAGDFVYFVHSFCAPVSDYSIATSEYGETFSAAIADGNFMGVQFHPEKSAAVGAKILANFLKIDTASLAAYNASLAADKQTTSTGGAA
ncbi:imidazole glycerol phosphate synthase subunit HisH [Shewanella avicenniae]|uniref:Imidazole glycerol phosphate synthase subunit HisH n=1 Tax=Shewanella avicenniae TaxID=2814294 RepID=A0ABX7QL93_9GAMM|nr:imidazole glycerol phosphate synthase subunit HisH [Shewanella avicenniae]QSX32154.1 imidazole glycerol phosphate synthase subunit HisH [Shewanella avicenniae]